MPTLLCFYRPSLQEAAAAAAVVERDVEAVADDSADEPVGQHDVQPVAEESDDEFAGECEDESTDECVAEVSEVEERDLPNVSLSQPTPAQRSGVEALDIDRVLIHNFPISFLEGMLGRSANLPTDRPTIARRCMLRYVLCRRL